VTGGTPGATFSGGKGDEFERVEKDTDILVAVGSGDGPFSAPGNGAEKIPRFFPWEGMDEQTFQPCHGNERRRLVVDGLPAGSGVNRL
jgi:hypothetical protein